MTKILIVDDHPLYREGVITALSGPPMRATVIGVSSTDDAIRLLDDDPTFELALIDLKLHGEDGLQAMRQIGARHAAVARVLISGEESPDLTAAAMRGGAQGFLTKSLSIGAMIGAIQSVLDGGLYWPQPTFDTVDISAGFALPPEVAAHPRLSVRQLQVLQLLSHGASNAQMAEQLAISERTVKAHLKALFDALGVDSRLRALVRAKELRLVE